MGDAKDKEDKIKSVVHKKFKVDTLKEALAIVGNLEGKEEIRNQLSKDLSTWEEKYEECLKILIGTFRKSENILKLGNSMYAVRCVSSDSVGLNVYHLLEEEIYLLENDIGNRYLSKRDVESLVPALVDEVAETLYTMEVQGNAYSLLSSLGEDLRPLEKDSKVVPSTHACKRWVQRMQGIKDDLQAEEYARKNLEEVLEEITSHFKDSEEIWNDGVGISYRLDKDNIVYIVGDKTIITLYEKDFGFTPSVNRMILFAQLKVVEESWEESEEVGKEYDRNLNLIDEDISQFNQQIKTKESEIEQIMALRTLSSSKKSVLEKQYSVAKQDFNQQFNKLFRGHKSR